MRRILLFGAAREQSTRVERKMTRPFAGTSLFEIYLDNLAMLWRSGLYSSRGVAVARCDETLWKTASALRADVPVIERSARSVGRGMQRRADELHFLDGFDEEFVLFLNGCMPLFDMELVLSLTREFLDDERIVSLTVTEKVHNWFWDAQTRKPLNNLDAHCLSTQGCTPVLGSVHAMNIYPRARMLERSLRWTLRSEFDPHVYAIHYPGEECMDVDTDEDFSACERAWRKRHEK